MGRENNIPPPSDFRRFLADTLVLRRETFLEQYALTLSKPEADPVHDLRVSIRRLSAVFTLIENIAGNVKCLEASDDIKEMMKPLGDLRDIQVRIQWIAKFLEDKSAPILDELKACETAMMASIGEETRRVDIGNIVSCNPEKCLKPLDDFIAESGGDLESLVREELWTLMARFAKRASQFNKTGDVADMHAARIALKKFRYTFEIFRPYFPNFDPAELSRLQTRLGDVHDLDLLITWIENIVPERPPEERETLLILLGRTRNDRADRMTKLKKNLKDDIELARKWRQKMVKKNTKRKTDPETARPAVIALAEKYDPEPEHATWVTELALAIYDELDRHGLISMPDSMRLLLEYGCLLHDIGWVDGQSGHHKKSFEMIMQSAIPLDEKDKLIAALVARFHRKADPAEQKDLLKLSKKDRGVVAKLSAIIRVADVLDRSHDQRARILSTSLESDAFVVKVTPGSIAGLTDEVVAKKTGLFENVFGMPVRFGDK